MLLTRSYKNSDCVRAQVIGQKCICALRVSLALSDLWRAAQLSRNLFYLFGTAKRLHAAVRDHRGKGEEHESFRFQLYSCLSAVAVASHFHMHIVKKTCFRMVNSCHGIQTRLSHCHMDKLFQINMKLKLINCLIRFQGLVLFDPSVRV